jgi:hypothetical protein
MLVVHLIHVGEDISDRCLVALVHLPVDQEAEYSEQEGCASDNRQSRCDPGEVIMGTRGELGVGSNPRDQSKPSARADAETHPAELADIRQRVGEFLDSCSYPPPVRVPHGKPVSGTDRIPDGSDRPVAPVRAVVRRPGHGKLPDLGCAASCECSQNFPEALSDRVAYGASVGAEPQPMWFELDERRQPSLQFKGGGSVRYQRRPAANRSPGAGTDRPPPSIRCCGWLLNSPMQSQARSLALRVRARGTRFRVSPCRGCDTRDLGCATLRMWLSASCRGPTGGMPLTDCNLELWYLTVRHVARCTWRYDACLTASCGRTSC